MGPFSDPIIVDTSKNPQNNLTKPTFTFTHTSSGTNTGMFDVNVHITNFDPNLNYVPAYFDIAENKNEWVYNTAQSTADFSFQIANPLRMPNRGDEDWTKQEEGTKRWETWDQSATYYAAVENCRTAYQYPDYTCRIKIIALNDQNMIESDEQSFTITEEDDNIPPSISNVITKHDSHLSEDGHYFSFSGLIREEEGHLSKQGNYYYTPYNEIWGDNLSVLSQEQIELLPGGTFSYSSGTWGDYWGNDYSINFDIPINGLADGDYMFFSKAFDTYENSTYFTLGKAHIGTFKNKLKVEYNPQKNPDHFICTLPIESDEHFEKNMINITELQHNNSDPETWSPIYGGDYLSNWLNGLQNCEIKQIDGKTVIYNENENKIYDNGDFLAWRTVNDGYPVWVNPNAPDVREDFIPVSPDELFSLQDGKGNFYKIIVQGFTMNSYNPETNTGVNVRYGSPYCEYKRDENTIMNDYKNGGQIVPEDENFQGSKTEYDLCTDETVSNTVYYYIPLDNEDLSNIRKTLDKSTAHPRSNHPYIVNVITSMRDLGNDIDDWERRGELIATHFYNGNSADNFDFNTAADDLFNSTSTGLLYYTCIVHFADNTSDISDVHTINLH